MAHRYTVSRDVPTLRAALEHITYLMHEAPSITIVQVRIGRLKGENNPEMKVELTCVEQERGKT